MGIRYELTNGNKDKPPRLERYQLLDKINSLDGNNALRDKALISFLYLTAARIEEVCKYIIEKNPSRVTTKKDEFGRKIKYKNPIEARVFMGNPIKKNQIELRDNVIMILDVRTLKRRDKRVRNIPIVVKPQEKPFINMFGAYYNTLKGADAPLFPITRARAYQILSRVGLFPHYLRHARNTHLVVDYGFTTEYLQKYNNWKDSKSAQAYVNLNLSDVIEKMQKA